MRLTSTNNLLTTWGEDLLKNPNEIPLPEYPRPQLERSEWQNLNGWWEYAITKSEDEPVQFDGKIRVPFSPETPLSGVLKNVGADDFLWYRREFSVGAGAKTEPKAGERTLLHFGAVDQMCHIFVNGQKVGEHVGGYWPFSIDVTDYLAAENVLVVRVQDFSDNPIYAYGKQKKEHGQIWYTPQSGIWQTVWLENVPRVYVTDLTLTPLFDEQQIKISVATNQKFSTGLVKIFAGEKIIADKDLAASENLSAAENLSTTENAERSEIRVALPEMYPWSPDDPFLYQVELTIDDDTVKSYFGIRKFSKKKLADGTVIPLLNNQPIFFNGLLDQGYWSDGLYTAPSDEALVWDIQAMKNLGFNMLRKHIKVEPLRWYYNCDRLGMLVWQDFVSGGAPYHPLVIQILPFINIQLKDNHYAWFGRAENASRERYLIEARETMQTLKNVTSLSTWVPFNEGWGQFDSVKVHDLVKKMDGSRFIDAVSGYHDQGAGDFRSPHIYFKKYRLKKDNYNRIQILSEFGGYSVPTNGHMATDKLFGYKKFAGKTEFMAAYDKLFQSEILLAIEKGLSGTVYTQVSDVEDEINGLVTFDRRVVKVDSVRLLALNKKIQAAFLRKFGGQ